MEAWLQRLWTFQWGT